MLRRDQVIQPYLDLFDHPRYLEVGVSEGVTFNALKAGHKVAVDPEFCIPYGRREARAEYHEVTSDDYFLRLNRAPSLFDVVYLDGLHTFDQTLRDLMNTIDVLRHDGVIIIDDVVPSSYHSSLPNHRDAVAVKDAVNSVDQSWMGDTYRLVYFIETFLPRFDYATVSDNHGQLVMWRARRQIGRVTRRRVEDVARLEFRDVVMQRYAFNFMPNALIVEQVCKRPNAAPGEPVSA